MFTGPKLVHAASAFAAYCHRHQKRKYSGLQYIVHPQQLADKAKKAGLSYEAIAAAWLHDTVEDVEVPLVLIDVLFGRRVHDLVEMLTDISRPSDGKRKLRKAIDRAHSAEADEEGQSLKVIDLICNFGDIIHADRDFAKVYVPEKRLLLEVLTKADPELLEEAWGLVQQWEQEQLDEALR